MINELKIFLWDLTIKFMIRYTNTHEFITKLMNEGINSLSVHDLHDFFVMRSVISYFSNIALNVIEISVWRKLFKMAAWKIRSYIQRLILFTFIYHLSLRDMWLLLIENNFNQLWEYLIFLSSKFIIKL